MLDFLHDPVSQYRRHHSHFWLQRRPCSGQTVILCPWLTAAHIQGRSQGWESYCMVDGGQSGTAGLDRTTIPRRQSRRLKQMYDMNWLPQYKKWLTLYAIRTSKHKWLLQSYIHIICHVQKIKSLDLVIDMSWKWFNRSNHSLQSFFYYRYTYLNDDTLSTDNKINY